MQKRDDNDIPELIFDDVPALFPLRRIVSYIYDPFIFANDNFSKIQSINFDGMALSDDLGPKCHIPLVPVLVHGLINYKIKTPKVNIVFAGI
jgi:hypothetical protein